MYLTGTEGDDILVGGSDDDTILGLDGDDLLIGAAGHNTLDGGAGSDTVSYADAAPAPMFSFLMINLSGQYVSIIGPAPAALDTLVSIENAVGSSGMDWLVGSVGDNHLSGGAGNDQVNGGGGADVLDGGAGDDTLATDIGVTSLQPGSLMLGGDGADSFRSGNSSDTMHGDAGNDLFQIQNYATTRVVDGGADIDTIEFAGGSAAYATGVAVDLALTGPQTVATNVVLTVSSVENVTGSSAGDVLFGDANANVLNGGAGDDQLHGRDGNDTLQGGDGDDLLDGGAGSDQLTGGAGADTFYIATADGGMEVITDLTSSDYIQFGDSPAGSTSNYVETNDLGLVASLFAGDGVRYVAVDLGGSVVLFADLGDEGTTYDQTIVLTGANLSSIDAGSLLGL